MPELCRRCSDSLGVGKDRTNGLSERVRCNPVIAEGFSNLAPLLAKAVRVANRPNTGSEDKAKFVRPGRICLALTEHFYRKGRLRTAENLTPYIAVRPWTLVRFNSRSLFTSDAPVSLIRNPKDEPWDGVGFMTAWGITMPLTRKVGLLMSDPSVMFGNFEANDAGLQELRAAVLRGEADRIQKGTTAMEKLFNEHSAFQAREYVYHHPEDEKFVPDDLPEPNLINIRAGGFMDVKGHEFLPTSGQVICPLVASKNARIWP